MRSRRSSLCVLAAFVLTALLAGAIAPAGADPVSFNRAVQSFVRSGFDFENVLQSIDSNGATPAGLKAWGSGVDMKAADLEYWSSTMVGQILWAGNQYTGRLPCGAQDAELNGPYGTTFGYERLAQSIAGEVSSWEAAIAKLDARQNELNHAIMAGRQYDKRFSNTDWSTALTAALKTAHNRYSVLANQSTALANQVKTLSATLAGPGCSLKNPAPVPTPTPSPTPKPADTVSKSKSGCVGFNGFWGSLQPYPMHIVGGTATQQRATSVWTFTGTTNGTVMSGTFTSTRGDKGTFTFTLRSNLDNFDAVITNSVGTKSVAAYYCSRGL